MDDARGSWIQAIAHDRAVYSLPPGLRRETDRFVDDLLGLLFPHFADTLDPRLDAVRDEVNRLERNLLAIMHRVEGCGGEPTAHCAKPFFDALGDVRERLLEDADAILAGDPAARSGDEVMLAYPSFYAIAVYRLANVLFRLGCPLLPRLFTEHAHRKTGIDIHPGATIGRALMIDHGTGVVIGETTVIGDRVKIYQGVTLGALAVRKELAGAKRHPTLEDNVVIYAHATILGGNTVVGHDSVVGGNAWLTESVPPFSVVTRPSQVRVRSRESLSEVLDWSI